MSKIYNEKILSNEPIAENIYSLNITCPPEAIREFEPGQFAHIQIPDSPDLLLRRPISIHTVNYSDNTMGFIYAVIGKGTKKLSEQKSGSVINVLMPLGAGFKIEERHKNIWLAGGGIGCAPLKSVIDKYSEKNYKLFLGFRSENQIYSLTHLGETGEILLSTEDGSVGEKGFITNVLAERLRTDNPDLILCCGPSPFFKSLKKIILNTDVETQASLEQRMGCGTGGCAVCVCSINGRYRKVCSDGPVFDLRGVDFID